MPPLAWDAFFLVIGAASFCKVRICWIIWRGLLSMIRPVLCALLIPRTNYLIPTKDNDNTIKKNKIIASFISSMRIGGHKMPMKKSECFEPPSAVWPRGTHFPGGNRRKIEIRID